LSGSSYHFYHDFFTGHEGEDARSLEAKLIYGLGTPVFVISFLLGEEKGFTFSAVFFNRSIPFLMLLYPFTAFEIWVKKGVDVCQLFSVAFWI